jgi:hypothetical protein
MSLKNFRGTALKKGMTVMIPHYIDGATGRPVHPRPDADGVRSWRHGPLRKVDVWRDTNEADREAWRASPASKGLNDAGETRLQSPTQHLRREEGDAHRLWEVVRARVAAPKGWGRKESGCAQVRDDEGVLWYVKREHCYPVRLR